MQSPESQIVIARFFEALQQLKDDRKIRGIQTFTTKYNINKRNLYFQKSNLESDIVQLSWFTYLVRDYGISATWLLTGEGSLYSLPESYKSDKPCKNSATDNTVFYKEI